MPTPSDRELDIIKQHIQTIASMPSEEAAVILSHIASLCIEGIGQIGNGDLLVKLRNSCSAEQQRLLSEN